MSGLAIKITAVKNGQTITEQQYTQDVIKIGRMASSHLQIDDEDISRMHAVIEIGTGGAVHVIDLGSAKGTFVNGAKVNKAPVKSSDVVQLGGVELRLAISEAAAVAAPPAAGLPQGAPAGGAPAFVPPGTAPAAAPARPRRRVQVDLTQFEDVTKEAIEVVVLWQTSVLQVHHYQAGAKKPETFYIGEDPTCNFPLPSEVLSGQTKVALVANREGGGADVLIPADATGDVSFEDGSRRTLGELIAAGQAKPSSDVPGAHTMSIPKRARMRVTLGEWTFLFNSVPNPKPFAAPLQFDWTGQVFSGGSLLLHALFFFLIYFIPPDPEGLSLDLLDANNRFVQYMLNPAELQQEEVPEWLKKKEKKKDDGGKGKRHKDDDGKMGKREAKPDKNKFGMKGAAVDPKMARDMAKDAAKNAGILSYLSSANAPTSPFGGEQQMGADPENALGALMGNQIGANFGFGGLGLAGTGRGGGGTGEGTIGLGSLNTIGHGGGGGSGTGYGRGVGGLGGRRARAPQIRSGTAMVKGSLSKDVIRRIVHRHINEVKFCYERELARRPDLSGRVAIKFIISGTGAVQMSAVASSTVGNPNVENCIAQAVRRWTFPQPKGGGIVIVTYPFQLTSPEG